ncbi:MAG: DUF126 domain-containing protein [Lachnospiraceae bacterium]|nr:DUF126 domain-containing protein [Lachnospiraceae bacterium]
MEIRDFRVIVSGAVSAEAVFSDVPLCFWGGVDPKTGLVTDVHHPLLGQSISGKILCIPCDRGSCSSSGVMLEMIRNRTHPAGIVCMEAEAVLALGPLIGEKVYQRSIPIRTVPEKEYKDLRHAHIITFTEDSILVFE